VTNEVISAVVGLISGLLTGFYFERRSTKSAEAQNKELRHELGVLRATVCSLGGDPDLREAPQLTPDLLAAVRARALVTQDASGKVGRLELSAHFIGRGVDASEVEEVIAQLCITGIARKEGRWLYIR